MPDHYEPRKTCDICGWVSVREDLAECIICERVVCVVNCEPCGHIVDGECVCCECDGSAAMDRAIDKAEFDRDWRRDHGAS